MATSGSTSAPANASTLNNKRRRDSMQQDIASHDYYNNLNINSTRTKSGFAASRCASDTDLPTLNSCTKKGSADAKSSANTANTAHTAVMSIIPFRPHITSLGLLLEFYVIPADAAEAKKWALHLFTTPTTTVVGAIDGDDAQKSCSSSTAPSASTTELGTRSHILEINLKRFYAIQRPAKHAVCLVVHSHYAPQILKICGDDGLNRITDSNLISANNLGDPHFSKTLSAKQSDDKAKAIYYNRMHQAAAQLGEPRVGFTIFKFFNALDSTDHHHVGKISAVNTARSVLKGFDASNLFTSLATSTYIADGYNPSTPLTDASDAGASFMDTNQ
ncbi:hypothetical protein MUCCIDRAFT_116280 [Mucor lusitanicus CBS 277.49]|uniref:Uncharacterized protein n=1 Tax=Mucor lusitanicus CBS 277.49 TaxID=747725 RepID=A0A168GES5_MUCCL|nr:hypothetical protein MUCCIDRAFT_116280 [Mucor lusitanicus CBS 277.49]